MGRPANSRRQGFANQRAHRAAEDLRALSVAIPVSAYMCRYIREINMNAKRPRVDWMKRERFQIDFHV
jgi:hypothetical protein